LSQGAAATLATYRHILRTNSEHAYCYVDYCFPSRFSSSLLEPS
jgi:hypothetical protein